MKKGTYIDYTGQVFGKLTAKRLIRVAQGTKGSIWEFSCGCGNSTYQASITDIKRHLKDGYNTGCGCERYNGSGQRTHGKTGTEEYSSWTAMKARCYNTKIISYKWYGAKGIRVCDRWLNSFESFLEDMGRRPDSNYSLDRIDINKDYYRENCRWATAKTQARNRRTNSFIKIGDETRTMAEWQDIFRISRTAFYYRLRKWTKAENVVQ